MLSFDVRSSVAGAPPLFAVQRFVALTCFCGALAPFVDHAGHICDEPAPEPGPNTAVSFIFPSLDQLIQDAWHDNGYGELPALEGTSRWLSQSAFEGLLDLFHRSGNSLSYAAMRDHLVVVPARFRDLLKTLQLMGVIQLDDWNDQAFLRRRFHRPMDTSNWPLIEASRAQG